MSQIPPEIQLAAQAIIEDFNRKILSRATQYVPRFKGAYLFLDRSDYGERPHEICRLEFTGSIDNWDFAIYKYSKEHYDPDEGFFTGAELLDGTIEAAMRSGLAAYPV